MFFRKNRTQVVNGFLFQRNFGSGEKYHSKVHFSHGEFKNRLIIHEISYIQDTDAL